MSLVYAKISDDIGMCFMCASRVSTCECSRFVWLRLYESLLTYVAHMDLVGDPLQDTCHARASEILLTKIHKIFYLGIRRIFM